MESIRDKIFNIKTEDDFNTLVLKVFHYQYNHVSLYNKFCQSLGVKNPQSFREIPCLPISFFKTHKILSDEIKTHELIFKSSGTTKSIRSQHFVADSEMYIHSFASSFKKFICNPEQSVIVALLPNYLEQGNSSLVYMVDYLIKASNNPLSGFYLKDVPGLLEAIDIARTKNKEVILFGVTYALLDLAEQNTDLSGVKIIETGGMKGRRKDIIREELHEILKKGLKVDKIYSEYGMTELFSQAYTDGSEVFTTPAWMKILIRDVNDPKSYTREGKSGGVNVIDLANLYSCSFIATDDLGVMKGNMFKIIGRFDNSDIRGCNLLVD